MIERVVIPAEAGIQLYFFGPGFRFSPVSSTGGMTAKTKRQKVLFQRAKVLRIILSL
jgi:hypothetical protein